MKPSSLRQSYPNSQLADVFFFHVRFLLPTLKPVLSRNPSNHGTLAVLRLLLLFRHQWTTGHRIMINMPSLLLNLILYMSYVSPSFRWLTILLP